MEPFSPGQTPLSAPDPSASASMGVNPSPGVPLVSPDPTALVEGLAPPQIEPTSRAAAPGFAPIPEEKVAMRPWRVLTIVSLVVAASSVGWQLWRVFDGAERSATLGWVAIAGAVVGAGSILVWTWCVVENARRLLAPATSQAPLSPTTVTLSWIAPGVVAVGAIAAVAFLQRRLILPENDTSSALPLVVAAAAALATLVVAMQPLGMISDALRRLGGSALPTDRLITVPIALTLVGGLSIVAMRAGGLFGEDFEGIAPAWALGVVLVVPTLVLLGAMWRGAASAEETVELAFDRRNGVVRTGVRKRRSLGSRLLRAEAFPRLPRSDSKPIRLLPGANVARLAMFTALIALCLIALIGALVMVLFWRESNEGLLVPAQQQRAWDVLERLQILQRWLALGLLAFTTIWAFISVLNARLATGRRRNPFIAAASWPLAAAGIWWLADRIEGEEVPVVVAGFVAQALVFYLPFVLLERSALAVSVPRSAFRLTYILGVVLMVQNQGLLGLSTLEVRAEFDDFGRLAGWLAVSALLQLVASLSVSESSRLISDAAADLAADHNELVERGRSAAAAPAVRPSLDPANFGGLPGSDQPARPVAGGVDTPMDS